MKLPIFRGGGPRNAKLISKHFAANLEAVHRVGNGVIVHRKCRVNFNPTIAPVTTTRRVRCADHFPE
ncbi:MAG TPA: hypothetical protein DIW81_08885 [Planctomycetaceae bacterium]|nr:hypothetical protein [Rubinisphaera sp.]HCS51691.1 hypothetical protein [Planctomycetaceae bacterium]